MKFYASVAKPGYSDGRHFVLVDPCNLGGIAVGRGFEARPRLYKHPRYVNRTLFSILSIFSCVNGNFTFDIIFVNIYR